MAYRKTKFSANVGQCVEVDFESVAPHVAIRHSKYPRHVIQYTPEEWDAFIRGVKDGEFDRPGAYQDADLAEQNARDGAFDYEGTLW